MQKLNYRKIGIATPTFGKAHYLSICIESIIKQTYNTSHVVCSGDLDIEDKIKDYPIQLINKRPDPGMVACWNIAAFYTESEYIGFLADDNSLEPEYSERMITFLDENKECDLVFCNQYHMDSSGNIDYEKSKSLTNYFGRSEFKEGIIDKSKYKSILEKNSIPFEACLIRKNIWDSFGPLRENAKGSFDQEFLYRLLLNDIKIGFIPEYLMRFRWHDESYCARNKKEHLMGSIWTNETLMNESKQYFSFFLRRTVDLKARLLRHNLSVYERLKLMKDLLKENAGFRLILKNTIAKVLNR